MQEMTKLEETNLKNTSYLTPTGSNLDHLVSLVALALSGLWRQRVKNAMLQMALLVVAWQAVCAARWHAPVYLQGAAGGAGGEMRSR
jgi:hypothetical protein